MNTPILVTGATGFLGRHLMPILQDLYGAEKVAGVSSANYDLLDHRQVRRMFADHRPGKLVHLAAYSGGIGVNRIYPADFYFRNTVLTALVFEEAARAGVQKMIYTMGGCSYPATASSPIGEEQMWNGYPQVESAGYSAAKKMGIVASRSYRTQHGLNSVVLIPGNMYGEFDNFRDGESHVVPAMIRRFCEARQQGLAAVDMWGTGAPQRDFVYAGDVAAALLYFLENYDSSEPVNISSGTRTSIRELAETVGELVGYSGAIRWDASKPDGQMIKIFDVARLSSLGLACSTPLRAGLERTIAWFQRNYATHGEALRV